MQTSDAQSISDQRIADIEVLRGWSIILVIMWHFNFTTNLGPFLSETTTDWLRMNVGVDLFFAISGYVIARSFLPRLEKADSFRDKTLFALKFWLRRAFRLFPAAWFWMAVILICSAVSTNADYWGTFSKNLDAAQSVFFYYANYMIATNFTSLGPASVYWSLSLEEQFYIFLPILALLAPNRKLLAALLIAALLIRITYPMGYIGVWFRYEGLVCGVLIAMLQQRSPARYHSIAELLLNHTATRFILLAIAVGFMFLFASPAAATFFGISQYRFYIFVAVFTTALVFVASQNKNYFMRSGWLSASFLWLGSRSYALYLCHLPSMIFSVELVELSGFYTNHATLGRILSAVLATIFMLCASDLSFRFLEMPLRQYGKNVTRRFA
ncbi:MAG: acyltransferase [Pseudomonadota bacterium]